MNERDQLKKDSSHFVRGPKEISVICRNPIVVLKFEAEGQIDELPLQNFVNRTTARRARIQRAGPRGRGRCSRG
jgi:hypothetical protein